MVEPDTVAVETASAHRTDYQPFARDLRNSPTSVDVAAVSAELPTYQSQSTAACTAISKTQSGNLASYLP
jgi:flagellar hook-associated protein 3 FlgL